MRTENSVNYYLLNDDIKPFQVQYIVKCDGRKVCYCSFFMRNVKKGS